MDMKKLILFIACLFVFKGCSTEKDFLNKLNLTAKDKTKADIMIDSTSVLKDTSTSHSSFVETIMKILEIDGSHVTEITITEYDTEKPIVEVTGKPPVLRETNKKTTKNIHQIDLNRQDQSSVNNYQTSLSDSTDVQVQDKSKYDIEQTGSLETKEYKTSKVKLFDIYTMFIIIIVIILAYFIYKYIRKKLF
jgi:Cu/Ag efflux pump CusA